MFVDELYIRAKAGNGGDGVVRWHREKFKPLGGPSGGNGGKGGNVYVRAVGNLNQLAKYTGSKEFAAEHGEAGQSVGRHGKNGEDLYIDVPVGAIVTNTELDRSVTLTTEGQIELVLHGGQGGLGNRYFKSSTNRSPQRATKGKRGEVGTFYIELPLTVDVGIIGLPNAGKSTLLNALTNANSEVGAYSFTTLEPHLGALGKYTLVDIPGLIEGAAAGKGLGHKFLRHVTRAKMLLHAISLEHEDPKNAYQTIFDELSKYDKSLLDREEWIILTKKDLVNKEEIEKRIKTIDILKKRVFVVSHNDPQTIADLSRALVAHLNAR